MQIISILTFSCSELVRRGSQLPGGTDIKVWLTTEANCHFSVQVTMCWTLIWTTWASFLLTPVQVIGDILKGISTIASVLQAVLHYNWGISESLNCKNAWT